MPKEIVIALISGLFGITGGIIAWVQAVKIGRLKADMDIAIEKVKAETLMTLEQMKAENERRRKAFEIATEETKVIEEALLKAWQALQKLKDICSVLTGSEFYDPYNLLNTLTISTTSIVNGYAEHGSELSESARSAWHSAKTLAGIIDAEIERTSRDDMGKIVLSTETIEILVKARISITDLQMRLLSARQHVRDERVTSIIKML